MKQSKLDYVIKMRSHVNFVVDFEIDDLIKNVLICINRRAEYLYSHKRNVPVFFLLSKLHLYNAILDRKMGSKYANRRKFNRQPFENLLL